MKKIKTISAMAVLCLALTGLKANALNLFKTAAKSDVPLYLTNSCTMLNKTAHKALKSDVPNYLKLQTVSKKQTNVLAKRNTLLSDIGPILTVQETVDESDYGWTVELQGNYNTYYYDSSTDARYFDGESEWNLGSIAPDTYTVTISYLYGSYDLPGYFDININWEDNCGNSQGETDYNEDWYEGYASPTVFTNIQVGDYNYGGIGITLAKHS
jgi:hypothetical protein